MSCPAQPSQRLAPPPDVRLNPFNAVFLFFSEFSLTLTDHTVALGSRMQLPYLLARP